jgi:hypothetical protein
MVLPDVAWAVIDTDVFQRLRFLAQTGLLRWVIPSATHDRFSHSLGTAFIAFQLLQHLRQAQPDLDITTGEVNTVVIAALCHDLGHGPASHSFDQFMRHIDPGWCHEHQSVLMLRFLAASRAHVGAALDHAGVDLHAACEMILGSPDMAPPGWDWRGPAPGREFLFDFVSNSTSGLDLDKCDYVTRDGKVLDIPGSFACQRLLTRARVIPVPVGPADTYRLAWPTAEAPNIMNLFLARYNLHQEAYQEAHTRVIDCMVIEALLLMRDMPIGTTGATLREAHRVPEAYIKTTDWVITLAMQGLVPDMPPGAVRIFERITSRDLWAQVARVTLPHGSEHVTVPGIARSLADLAGVAPADFELSMSCISCGRGRKDPMSRVFFFEEREAEGEGDEPSLQLSQKVTSYIRPMYCETRVLHVFAKADEDVLALEAGVRIWVASTPGSAISDLWSRTHILGSHHRHCPTPDVSSEGGVLGHGGHVDAGLVRGRPGPGGGGHRLEPVDAPVQGAAEGRGQGRGFAGSGDVAL